MIVAQIIVSTGRFHYEQRHTVGFTKLEKAQSEYDRVAALLTKRNERGNDLPKTVEIDGDSGGKFTVGMDDISSIALLDFAWANEQEKGVAEAFPFLFRKHA